MFTPETVTVAEALTVEVPTTELVTMIVHWPDAFVGPLPHVPPLMLPTPVSEPVTVTPEAAVQPVPSFFSTVTVNVCGSPTLFVPEVPMLIRASTQVFVLLTLFAP